MIFKAIMVIVFKSKSVKNIGVSNIKIHQVKGSKKCIYPFFIMVCHRHGAFCQGLTKTIYTQFEELVALGLY